MTMKLSRTTTDNFQVLTAVRDRVSVISDCSDTPHSWTTLTYLLADPLLGSDPENTREY